MGFVRLKFDISHTGNCFNKAYHCRIRTLNRESSKKKNELSEIKIVK